MLRSKPNYTLAPQPRNKQYSQSFGRTVSDNLLISSLATEFLTIDIWTNNTSPNVISDVKVLINSSQVPHVIQFNVTQPSFIFLTEPFGVYNNGSSYGIRYASNNSSVPILANVKAEYLYSAQEISGLIWVELTVPAA